MKKTYFAVMWIPFLLGALVIVGSTTDVAQATEIALGIAALALVGGLIFA